MVTVSPGETLTISQDGIPTGQAVGFQVIKAATGTVALGRSTVGVVERPAGSGNYIATFVAPVEADLYLIVIDWNNGVITTTKSKVEEMQVTSAAAQADTGLGEVADYAKMALGGESFKLLSEAPSYGTSFISLAVEAVKARVMSTIVDVSMEGALPRIVLSYLGKLAALELMPAVYDVWMTRPEAEAVGNDPVETVTYPNREGILKAVTDRLLAQVRAEQALAIKLLPDARALDTSSGPSIDEDAFGRVTPDPRRFPRQENFPYPNSQPAVACDPLRYGP